jgi:hypothetical protein
MFNQFKFKKESKRELGDLFYLQQSEFQEMLMRIHKQSI